MIILPMAENSTGPDDASPFWNAAEVPAETSEEFTTLIKGKLSSSCHLIHSHIQNQVNPAGQIIRGSFIVHQIATMQLGMKHRIHKPILHSEIKGQRRALICMVK